MGYLIEDIATLLSLMGNSEIVRPAPVGMRADMPHLAVSRDWRVCLVGVDHTNDPASPYASLIRDVHSAFIAHNPDGGIALVEGRLRDVAQCASWHEALAQDYDPGLLTWLAHQSGMEPHAAEPNDALLKDACVEQFGRPLTALHYYAVLARFFIGKGIAGETADALIRTQGVPFQQAVAAYSDLGPHFTYKALEETWQRVHPSMPLDPDAPLPDGSLRTPAWYRWATHAICPKGTLEKPCTPLQKLDHLRLGVRDQSYAQFIGEQQAPTLAVLGTLHVGALAQRPELLGIHEEQWIRRAGHAACYAVLANT